MRSLRFFLLIGFLIGLASQSRAQVVAGNPEPLAQTTTTANNLVVKGSAGYLYDLGLANTSTAGFVMVFNATAAPSDGAVTPSLCWPVPANTGFEHAFVWPVPFNTGITAVFSTGASCFSKTGANAFIQAQYR